ncbi:hypothetical protein K6Y31_03430 [Motilimonas cestriensis]|uniref:Lysozyme inhibitor LprI N-terminal domain-containing protein n=1 Tax=Motilimonas cestriensis TaxID=2742685 RepID=A0ABS8W6Z2_9GAMM|nr:hypothetical protein [Motilimonas cestriensis]MCE2593862.1 hypothetical protein [Motilimonas cestriensis]
MRNIMLAGVLTCVSMTSWAGVAETKAKRGADEVISQSANKMQQACGNTALTVTVNWDEFDSMLAANKAQLAEKKYQDAWVLNHAGERTSALLDSIAAICNDDADYQAEIAKLTAVVVMPKGDFADTKTDLALADTSLTVQSGHYMRRTASDFTARIKALY